MTRMQQQSGQKSDGVLLMLRSITPRSSERCGRVYRSSIIRELGIATFRVWLFTNPRLPGSDFRGVMERSIIAVSSLMSWGVGHFLLKLLDRPDSLLRGCIRHCSCIHFWNRQYDQQHECLQGEMKAWFRIKFAIITFRLFLFRPSGYKNGAILLFPLFFFFVWKTLGFNL